MLETVIGLTGLGVGAVLGVIAALTTRPERVVTEYVEPDACINIQKNLKFLRSTILERYQLSMWENDVYMRGVCQGFWEALDIMDYPNAVPRPGYGHIDRRKTATFVSTLVVEDEHTRVDLPDDPIVGLER